MVVMGQTKIFKFTVIKYVLGILRVVSSFSENPNPKIHSVLFTFFILSQFSKFTVKSLDNSLINTISWCVMKTSNNLTVQRQILAPSNKSIDFLAQRQLTLWNWFLLRKQFTCAFFSPFFTCHWRCGYVIAN